MKKVLFLIPFAIIFIIISSFKKSSEIQTLELKKNVLVIFNHTLTYNDIVTIKQDLSKKEIILTYRRLVFDENSKLQGISYEVRCGKYGGGDDVDNLTNESRIGFYRDYSKNAPKDFICGNLKDLRIPSTN